MIAVLPVFGVMETNCYFFGDEKSRSGFVIDPGAQGGDIARVLQEQGWRVEKILLTHGHFDHIGGAWELRRITGAPIFAHEKGPMLLQDPEKNLSAFHGEKIILDDVQLFREGDLLTLQEPASLSLRVIHTPGHTADSCVFYCQQEDCAFVGDTIFRGDYGATHFPTGNHAALMASIREKILRLPPQTALYSGHSGPTTVAEEAPHYPEE